MKLGDAFKLSKNTFLKTDAPKRAENLFTGFKPTATARSAMGLAAGVGIATRAAVSEATPSAGKKIPGLQKAPAMGWDMSNATTGTGALAQALGSMGRSGATRTPP